MTEPAMCPTCGKPADDVALILYGICDGCVRPPINRERTSAVTDAYADDNGPELRVIEDDNERARVRDADDYREFYGSGTYRGTCRTEEYVEPWYDPFGRCPGDRTLRRWWL